MISNRTDEEVIADFRARLVAGHYGERAFMLPEEETYLGMWSALMQHLDGLQDRYGFDNPIVRDVITEAHRLVDARSNPVRVVAVSTTELGREEIGHSQTIGS